MPKFKISVKNKKLSQHYDVSWTIQPNRPDELLELIREMQVLTNPNKHPIPTLTSIIIHAGEGQSVLLVSIFTKDERVRTHLSSKDTKFFAYNKYTPTPEPDTLNFHIPIYAVKAWLPAFLIHFDSKIEQFPKGLIPHIFEYINKQYNEHLSYEECCNALFYPQFENILVEDKIDETRHAELLTLLRSRICQNPDILKNLGIFCKNFENPRLSIETFYYAFLFSKSNISLHQEISQLIAEELFNHDSMDIKFLEELEKCKLEKELAKKYKETKSDTNRQLNSVSTIGEVCGLDEHDEDNKRDDENRKRLEKAFEYASRAGNSESATELRSKIFNILSDGTMEGMANVKVLRIKDLEFAVQNQLVLAAHIKKLNETISSLKTEQAALKAELNSQKTTVQVALPAASANETSNSPEQSTVTFSRAASALQTSGTLGDLVTGSNDNNNSSNITL